MTKTTLYLIPIEPFPGRYTEAWYKNFPEDFKMVYGKDNVKVIDGVPLSSEIRVGTFLDMSSTLHYKATQTAAFARLLSEGAIHDGDAFFFSDLEYWGLEAFRLALDMHGLKKCVIGGFLHAGSYTREDAFAIAASYQRFTEVGWAHSVDRIYVGSYYHEDAFINRRVKPLTPHDSAGSQIRGKIRMYGNPMWTFDYPAIKAMKKRKVILPNRFDKEKRALTSLYVVEALHRVDPTIECVLTTSHPTLRSNHPEALAKARELAALGILTIKEGLTKLEYYQELAESKALLSTSAEENFGYCIAEGLHYKTLPVFGQGASHPEFLDTPLGLNYSGFFNFQYVEVDNLMDAPRIANAVLRVLNEPFDPNHTAFKSTRLYDSFNAGLEIASDLNSVTR